MRREGYELQVSQPQVIIKENHVKSPDGDHVTRLEPFEEAVIDVPKEMAGAIIEALGKRKGILKHIEHNRLIFEIPTRGILGYRNQFMIDTRGEGIFSSRVIGFQPYAGDIEMRSVGSMVSMEAGTTTAYSLDNLQQRGTLYVGANV